MCVCVLFFFFDDAATTEIYTLSLHDALPFCFQPHLKTDLTPFFSAFFRPRGVIALPLRSLLYVRQVDVPKLDAKYGWEFRTKHELAVELVLWFLTTVRELGIEASVWVVADGAYAARPFLLPLVERGVVVVSRLRKDASLFDLPPERKPGRRGRPRIYGENKLSLKKRAADRKSVV